MTAAPDRAPAVSRRWPWVGAAALLMLAAAATACSTYLHWLPCRGTMLDGSVLAARPSVMNFSEACLRRMDTSTPFPYPPEVAEQAPWASELGAAAMALSGLAWLVLVLEVRSSRRDTFVAALPTVVSLAMAALCLAAAANRDRDPDAYTPLWLLLAVEVVAVPALVLVWRRQPERGGRRFVSLVVVAWGATAFGLVHQVLDYFTMTAFSQANWDTPPGTGYGTALVLVLAAAAAAFGLPQVSPARRASADQPVRRPRTAAGPPAGSPRAS